MRVLRIAIRNFQGVRYNEVQFAPVGVTILEGPNEIGKRVWSGRSTCSSMNSTPRGRNVSETFRPSGAVPVRK